MKLPWPKHDKASILLYLVVLDASQDWKMIERISLHIGRKHYRATSVEDLLALDSVL